MIVPHEMSVIPKGTAPCTNSAACEALAQFGDSLENVAVSGDWLIANFRKLTCSPNHNLFIKCELFHVLKKAQI